MTPPRDPEVRSDVLLVEVRALLATLRPSERRIADLLLADPGDFATRSVAEVAERAATSTTTVVRFTHRLGYQRFRDLCLDLATQGLRESLRRETWPVAGSDISPQDTLAEVVGKIAATEALSIADTAQSLDLAELERAVAAVHGAARVDLYGVGAGAVVAVDLQRKLSRIGRVALEWPDAHAAWTAAAVLDPGAVAIAVSHSGATAETLEFLRIARASGARTIAVTNHDRSPLARTADIVLRTAARETAFRSGALGSRIAQLMVVDCLFVGVAQAGYDDSVVALRKTYQAVSGAARG